VSRVPATPSVEVRGATKCFDGRFAIRNVDFMAWPGEVHAVLGENGAGKSTLVSVISGLYRPDHGAVIIGGRPMAFRSPRDALRAGIGVVHQEVRLVDNLSVIENIVLGAGVRPAAGRRHLLELISETGFDLRPDAMVRDLDIGRRQQVEILKLLFRRLDVLIFDEPTTILSPPQVTELFKVFARLAAERRTVIFITHRLREVRQIADRITVLRGGQVVAAGIRPDDCSDAALTQLMIGAGGAAAREPLPEPRGGPAGAVLEIADAWVSSTTGSGLRGVSLTVVEGEVVGVAGVRGNGQRELGELAAGLLVPERGAVNRRPATVSFIPEDRVGMGLARDMSVAHNLAFHRYREAPIGRPLLLNAKWLRAFAAGLIGAYRIPADPRWNVMRLSGGNLQRVVVAREFERPSPLVVAMQPTRGLDVRSAAFVRRQLAVAVRRGAGVLLISEDLDEVLEVSGRIVVLDQGKIVAEIPRAQFDRQHIGRLMVAGSRPAEAGAEAP
jgi:ABC-type uncharacterized transport system ATPase subunit